MMMPLPTAVIIALSLLTQTGAGTPVETVEVRALSLDDAGETVPAPGVNVAVFLLDRSGRSASGTTGPDGRVRISLERAEGVRYRAVVRQGDGLTFTSHPFSADSPIEDRTVSILPTREDASHVQVQELLTLLSPHEGYIVVEQAFSFVNDAPFVVRSAGAPGSPERWGVDIPLHEGAESAVVDVPDDHDLFQVSDDGVRYFGPIGPEGTVLEHRWHLVVRYSIKLPGATHHFAQALGMPVREATVAVTQQTPFERNPRVDVGLSVPPCDAGVPAGVLCFDDFQSLGAVAEFLAGTDRRAISGGHAEGDAVLRFDTTGWPTPPRSVQWAVAVASILVVLGGIGMWLSASRARPGEGATGARARRLEVRRQHLLAQLVDLGRAHESGEIPQSEYELQDLALRARLDGVLRELFGEPKRAA